jgi:hypothetical protein
MLKPPYVVLILLAVAALAAYVFWPGASRVAHETYRGLQEDELAENWEYYFDLEIEKIETKASELEAQRVETMKRAIEVEGEINSLSEEVDRANALISETAMKIRRAREAGDDELVEVLGREIPVADAVDQLSDWISERQSKESTLARLAGSLERVEAAQQKELKYTQAVSERIMELKAEKAQYQVDMKIADIEDRLRTLSEIGNAWVASDPSSGLEGVRAAVGDKLLTAEARARLAADFDEIDAKVGLDQALSSSQSAQRDASVKAELEALLGGG